MSSYKLVYFNSRGRAEVIRLIFAVVEQKYDDHRIEAADWQDAKDYKDEAPFGQLPYLLIKDDKTELKLAQSMAITRYLAKKYNLIGNGDNEEAECNMYADQLSDLFTEFGHFFFESDPKRKEEMRKKFTNQTVPHNMKILEEKLTSNKTGYLIGDGLTMVDLIMVVGFEALTTGGFKQFDMSKAFNDYPLVHSHYNKIRSLEKINEWIQCRPQTNY